MIEVLRTPNERFEHLPNFPYDPQYIDGLKGFGDLRMHYIDEGPKYSEEVFLCLHGEPTWAYLYRKMAPVFLNAGYRVVAPDFFGFGRSDKPIEDSIYTFKFHRNSLIEFIKRLDLDNLTLVVQDWGGILGLTLPVSFPTKIKRLVLMNTIFGTGDFEISQGFKGFRDWASQTPDMKVGELMLRSTPHLTQDDIIAYNAPFPNIEYKAGVRRFPQLVPTSYNAPGAELSRIARDWFQDKWAGESFMAVGKQDPVLGPPMMEILREMIPRCPEPMMIKDAGHFVQEWGEIIAVKALEAFNLWGFSNFTAL
ncbi:MAG: haloalkane dehalogenase [Promethearchaeota archaeon]|jgi:pimeloyl-ACP methyl ester carboxylesterase